MLRIALRQSLLLTRHSQLRVARPAMLCAPSIIAARFETNDGGAGSTVKERQQYLQADWVAPKLSYEEVKKRTQEPTEDAYLIDVREPEEIAQGSIPSSVPLPLSTLSSSLHLRGDEFLDKHGFMKPAYNQEIVFYCRSGRRSATASDVARRNGYTNVKNYEGSWLDWVRKDRPSPAA
ncbi:Rhodanese-like domain-containing protein [Gautieria morchelliformis]|nr:Rhodanese-like domain-containing protein [Gautieria morchelliformis]